MNIYQRFITNIEKIWLILLVLLCILLIASQVVLSINENMRPHLNKTIYSEGVYEQRNDSVYEALQAL